MPIFGGGAANREKKKQTVLNKLTDFFNKFFGISSDTIPAEPLERLILANVEDDNDVRNLIYNRLIMDSTTPDSDLQYEVIEQYGTRYPDMSLNDWRHIIEDYTPMVRKNIKDVDLEEDAKEIPFYYSKAAEDLEKPKDD